MNFILNEPVAQFAALFVLRGFAQPLCRAHRSARLMLNCVFFAALTALLLYNDIPPYGHDSTAGFAARITNGAVKTVWWISGATVLVSCVRLFLILEREPRQGRLLQDLVIALIYVSAALNIVAYVFNLPVGTVIATSGVFAIVLGLALQSTLNDVFSGIALNLNKPLSLGDWVVLDDDVQGRVLETNWRSTHLLNRTGDLVVIPNSLLAKGRITNLSVPDNSHGSNLTLRLQANRRPGFILETMENVLLSSNTILRNPPPTAALRSLEQNCIEVELSFRVPDVTAVLHARNELFDLVYRHSKTSGLKSVSLENSGSSLSSAESPRDDLLDGYILRHLLDAVPLFDFLSPAEIETVATKARRSVIKQDEVIVAKGAALTSLVILARGVAVLEDVADGSFTEITRLAPGDFFGERGVLLGQTEACNVRALTAAIIYEIPKAQIAAILKERPSVAEDLARVLSSRTKAEEAMHKTGRVQIPGNRSFLRLKIRELFNLQT